MSIIVGYAVRSGALVLAETLAQVDATLEIERTVATDPDHPTMFLWVEGGVDAFDAAARDDPTVTNLEVLSEVDGQRLYSMQITEATEIVLYPAWADLGAERLQAYHADGWWHARSRFPDRASFATYREFLENHGVEFRLKHLHQGTKTTGEPAHLTPQQRETLRLAYERGYFEIPRAVTTAELAAALDISDQAVSERLRRGYARLIESALRVDDGRTNAE
ncbi:helix-turn-helix domain-containing protein [Halorarius halobius]|uniref:helix-turn-helix domain-containing protein n=1 Tax=Halorarius halobius TaxID=2962671 RepID=UPI0020CF4DCF|nr:helix-turn-helix domain-containing protein [Halorarius halobius]